MIRFDERSTAEMVAAGGYNGYINPAINSVNFSRLLKTGSAFLDVFRLPADCSPDRARRELFEVGMDGPSMDHMLFFGATHPSLQRGTQITFLGARCTDSNGYPQVGMLSGIGENRHCSLLWDHDGMVLPAGSLIAGIRFPS